MIIIHVFLKTLPVHTQVIISLSLIIFSGFLMTRLTNLLKLPKVTGYIVAGIIIGPDVLHLIPKELSYNFSFISDVALSFIAFDVGQFFRREVLKTTGLKVIFITVAEALAAGIVVYLSCLLLFRLDNNFALLLGAIATATAPASTMMTIKEYKAKGEFINILLQVVALDDVVCLLVFSSVIVVVQGAGSLMGVLVPIGLNVLAVVIGYVMGLLLNKALTPTRSKDNRLLLGLAFVLLITGFCQIIEVSPLLSCMVFGAGYRNKRKTGYLFKQVNRFNPPIMATFFIVSGMNLSIPTLLEMKTIGIVYFLMRIVGKYFGTFFSCKLLKMDPKITKYLGLALVPQAGVALGLGFMGRRLLGGSTGETFLNIILASSVLYEIVGPALAKTAIVNVAEIEKK